MHHTIKTGVVFALQDQHCALVSITSLELSGCISAVESWTPSVSVYILLKIGLLKFVEKKIHCKN